MQIVMLTGAGVSADSGVSTFRDKDGVWAKVDYRQVATPEGFLEDPERCHAFYNARRAGLKDVGPNAAHRAIASLQRRLAETDGRLTLVTQNVDDLHERGGATEVWHMHGELMKARCDHPRTGGCGVVTAWSEDLSTRTQCPACGLVGAMRPHVVWFNEMPFLLDEIAARIADADMFVSVGTSGSVYPAAGFVYEAKRRNVHCVELNLEPSDNAAEFDDARYGRAEDIAPAWVDEMMSRLDV